MVPYVYATAWAGRLCTVRVGCQRVLHILFSIKSQNGRLCILLHGMVYIFKGVGQPALYGECRVSKVSHILLSVRYQNVSLFRMSHTFFCMGPCVYSKTWGSRLCAVNGGSQKMSHIPQSVGCQNAVCCSVLQCVAVCCSRNMRCMSTCVRD